MDFTLHYKNLMTLKIVHDLLLLSNANIVRVMSVTITINFQLLIKLISIC